MASDIVLKNNLEKELRISHIDDKPAKSLDTDDLTYTRATVADMEAISNPQDGDVCFVKDLNRGGSFIYDSSEVANDNQGTNFNGWIRQYSGAVNIKWFGAINDNSTNTADIMQTIIELEKPIVGTGVYKIEKPVYIPDLGSFDIKAIGYLEFSQDSTTDPLGLGDGEYSMFTAKQDDDSVTTQTVVNIDGVVFNGNSDYLTLPIANNNLLAFYNTKNVIIKNCQFINSPSDGLRFESISEPVASLDNQNIIIENNLFYRNRDNGLALTGVSYASVKNNIFDNIRQGESLLAKNIVEYNFIGNIFKNAYQVITLANAELAAYTQRGIISNNIVDGCTDFVVFAGADISNTSIVNNYIEDAKKGVFSFSGSNIVVSGNLCNNYKNYGLACVVDNSIISDNIFKRDTNDTLVQVGAILLQSGSDNCVVNGNTITNSASITLGRSINSNGNGHIISNNNITCTNDDFPIIVSSTNTMINNNSIKGDNSGNGIRTIANNISVINNHIENVLNGIIYSSGSGLIRAGNTFINVTTNKYTGDTSGSSFDVGKLGVSDSASATTLGTVTKKFEVFDKNGNSVGFVPLYDSIS